MSNEKEDSDIINGLFAKWKQYSKITNLGPIFRRYFVMNAFDGVLTALGLIMSYFIAQSTGKIVTRELIITNGVSVTLAIGISGFIGAYLAETAEIRKASLEQKRIMMLPTDEDGDNDPLSDETVVNLKEEDYYSLAELEENTERMDAIRGEKIDLDPKPINFDGERNNVYRNVTLEKSISEKAETFAFIMLSLADGISPVLGAIIGLIPFFFAQPDTPVYIISLLIEVTMLFLLGVFLAKISEESIWKYGAQMVLAGVVTAIISTALQSINV